MSPTAENSAMEPVEILLVDDRPENLLALEAVLDSPEYKLVKVTSGDAALRYLLEQSPALILMDVQMPKLDGFATAAIIKGSTRTREIPIIFLTAIGKDERYIHKGYSHGAVDYLYKPLDSHILRSKVAVFADLHRKNESLLKAERRLRESERKERERRIAELELKSLRREQVEQKRYRDLVEGLDQGIVWSAVPGTMELNYVSPAAERILGHTSSSLQQGKSFWDHLVHPDDKASFLAAVKKVANEEGDASIEHRSLSANGILIWFHSGIKLGTDQEGNEGEIRGLSVDITKIKEAERQLRISKTRSDLLAAVGFTMAESFDYIAALPKLTELLTREFADWAQVEIFTEDGKQEAIAVSHSDPLENRRAQGLVQTWSGSSSSASMKAGFYPRLSLGELEHLSVSDSHFQYLNRLNLSSAMVISLNTRGKSLGWLTLGNSKRSEKFQESDFELGHDLAFRISAAVDNWRLYEEAQNAIKVRDEFLSIASHELKTPLTPLKIQTQQLLRLLKKESLAGLDPEKVEKMLSTANRQIDRLSKLIDDLLDISRISMGKLQLHLEEFDLMEVAADLKQRFGGQLSTAGCNLTIDGPSSLMVRWDLFRAEQVIVNLLTNAMKYGPERPIEMKIAENNGMVTISMRDHGIGIAPEDQERIFRRFERAVSGTHFGGLGLGLYIVSQILNAHGGRIAVESKVGFGANFWAEIPSDVGAYLASKDSKEQSIGAASVTAG